MVKQFTYKRSENAVHALMMIMRITYITAKRLVGRDDFVNGMQTLQKENPAKAALGVLIANVALHIKHLISKRMDNNTQPLTYTTITVAATSIPTAPYYFRSFWGAMN